MKKYLLLILALFLLESASAQVVTLEATYSNFQIVSMTSGQYYMSRSSNAITLYNLNHSVYKSFNIPVVSGKTAVGIYCMSEKLFNANDKIEYHVMWRDGSNVSSGAIVDEDGNILQSFADGSSVSYATQTEAGPRFVLTFGASSTRVYSFNTVPTAVSNVRKSSDAVPFPNPAKESIKLPYELAPGEVGTLRILNTNGITVKYYMVGSDFDHLLVDTSDLAPGMYTYLIEGSEVKPGKSFIVQ